MGEGEKRNDKRGTEERKTAGKEDCREGRLPS
jgi:hypothetical protein